MQYTMKYDQRHPDADESEIQMINSYMPKYCPYCGSEKFTKKSVRCMINSYCQACGISLHITPHMFRHSFATLLLEQDVDIRYIQKLLGHSSITTTQIYTHVTSAKQKEIIKTKHPRNNLNIS